MRLASALRADARLQRRGGFYAAYLFIAAVYGVLLASLRPDLRALALPPVLLTETAVVGFFFAGALLHLERGDGTLHALAVTPLRPLEYVLAKSLSLALLATPAALGIGWAAAGGTVDWPVLALGSALAAAFFAALGLALSCRIATLERFALWGGLGTAVLGLPALPYVGIADSPLWALFPTAPFLAALAAGTGLPAPFALHPLLGLSVQAAWVAAAVLLARSWVVRFGFGRSGGVG